MGRRSASAKGAAAAAAAPSSKERLRHQQPHHEEQHEQREQHHEEEQQPQQPPPPPPVVVHDAIRDSLRSSTSASLALSKRALRRVAVDAAASGGVRRNGRGAGRKRKEGTVGTEEEVKVKDGGLETVVDVQEREPSLEKEEENKAGVAACEAEGKGETDVEICEPGEKEKVSDGKGEGDGEAEGEENESEDEDEEEGSDEEDDGGLEVLGEGFYEVEAVRKKRVRKGTVQYYIKWRGWPESANTWEPFDNVKDCADIIEDFEKSHIGRPGRRGRGKRRFGTYLLPLKKKQRTSPSNAEESAGAVDLGKDADGTSNEQISAEQNGEKLVDPIAIPDITPIQFSELEVPSGGVTEIETKTDTGISTPLSVDVVSIGERGDAEFNVNVGELQDGIDMEQSQDKLMILAGETSLKDVMVDASGSGYELVTSPNTVSTKVPLDEIRFPSDSTSVEIVAESRIANGHCEVNEESLVMDAGQLRHASTTTEIGSETTIPIKGARKKVTGEEPGKLVGNDKCTGAKKRKQGFVRRVRQGLESQEHDGHHMNEEEKAKDIEHVFEEPKFANGGDPGIEDSKVVVKTTDHQYCPPQVHEPKANAIVEITKAVTFSSSTANGKQDVSVLFKALRSDGLEVMVDNTFLRANYPLLLIDFYEQHLRYSTA
eukprot:c25821_g1_i2 orf=252-2225(+)